MGDIIIALGGYSDRGDRVAKNSSHIAGFLRLCVCVCVCVCVCEELFSFSFLQLQLWHIEVPWLGVASELQLQAYAIGKG